MEILESHCEREISIFKMMVNLIMKFLTFLHTIFERGVSSVFNLLCDVKLLSKEKRIHDYQGRSFFKTRRGSLYDLFLQSRTL